MNNPAPPSLTIEKALDAMKYLEKFLFFYEDDPTTSRDMNKIHKNTIKILK